MRLQRRNNTLTIFLGLATIQFASGVLASADCDSLSYYSEELGKCLKYATEYSATCYEAQQCTEWVEGVKNLSCINNRCICQDRYRWFQGKCQKYVGKGEECTENIDCYDEMDPLSLTCQGFLKKTCQCSKGYYDRGQDCRVKSALFGDCAIKSDCQKVQFAIITLYSTCALGTCVSSSQNDGVEDYLEEYYKDVDVTPTISQYLLNYIMKEETNQTSTRCEQGVKNSTTEIECTQCNNTMWFKDSVCICEPGFFLKNGICVAELGMQDKHTGYSADKDCPIKPGKLTDNTCYCKNYWFNDNTNRNCIKTTLEITKSCMTDTWCKAMGPYSFCNTTSGQCQCDTVASFNETKFYCELSDKANSTKVCKNTNCPLNEECRDQQCSCVDNFARINGTCLPEIGGSCDFQNCSHIPNSVCSGEKMCECENRYVSDSTRCLKVAQRIFDDCIVQNQCQTVPHSVCDKYKSGNVTKIGCICDQDYVNVNGTCYAYKTYGSTCQTRKNCTIVMNDSLQCRNSICQCPVSKMYKDGYCSAALMRFDNHQIALFVTVVLAWFLCKF